MMRWNPPRCRLVESQPDLGVEEKEFVIGNCPTPTIMKHQVLLLPCQTLYPDLEDVVMAWEREVWVT